MYSRNTKAAPNEMQTVEMCLRYSEVNYEENMSSFVRRVLIQILLLVG